MAPHNDLPPRKLAKLAGITQKRLRELVQVSYVKVSEYQHRGLVHLHTVIRLDKGMPDYRSGEIRPPDRRFTSELLEQALRATVEAVKVEIPDELGAGTIRWGEQRDTSWRPIISRRPSMTKILCMAAVAVVVVAGLLALGASALGAVGVAAFMVAVVFDLGLAAQAGGTAGTAVSTVAADVDGVLAAGRNSAGALIRPASRRLQIRSWGCATWFDHRSPLGRWYVVPLT